MKVRAILAVALAAAACAPEDIYQSDLTPDARCDVPSGADVPNARDAVAPLDLGASDGSTRVDAGAGVIPVFDVVRDTGPPPCRDEDGDGISDDLEGSPFLRTAMAAGAMPDYQNTDSDEDGVPDVDEARRNYPGFASAARPALTCGDLPDDCDMDGYANQRDRDADNDGLTDREEAMRTHTDPCVADTDGDGVGDLTESAAGSSPTDPMSRPPAGSLYVTLPYMDPMGPQTRSFDFSTRIRSADIMFLVDTTGSMSGTITAVRNTLSTTIVPGIVRAIGPGADMRYGMSEHRDFANGGGSGDFALRVLQRLDANPMLSQAATGALSASGGGDGPESQVPAMHSLISGYGLPGVRRRRDAHGHRGRLRRRRDLLRLGLLPTRARAHRRAVLRRRLAQRHRDADDQLLRPRPGPRRGRSSSRRCAGEAYFVGIDVAAARPTAPRLALARDPQRRRRGQAHRVPRRALVGHRQRDQRGHHARAGHPAGRQPPRRRRPHGDPPRRRAPHRGLPHRIVPLRGTPAAPAGFDRFDATTFYNVSPSTVVTFEVTFFNDFHRNTSGAAQLFRASIEVLGRASSVLDTIQVFVIVPADANSTPG
nr:hypothetical protein [Deltaproteobacteria bacterium]